MGGLHITSATLILVIAVFHLFFNWRIFLFHLKAKKSSGFRLKAETGAALFVTVVLIVGTLGGYRPFNTVVTGSYRFKDYWEQASSRETVPHAEEMTLGAVALAGRGQGSCGRRSRASACSMDGASDSGCLEARSCSGDEKTGTDCPGRGYGGGRGLGRISLAQLCNEEGLDVSSALARLQEKGLRVSESQTLREISDRLGAHPRDLVQILAIH